MSKLAVALIASVLVHQFSSISAVLPADYQSKSAAEKQDLLWEQISTEPYASNALPVGGHSPLQMSVLGLYTHYPLSFNHDEDEMPEGRNKLFHPYGSCARATLKIFDSSTYTGVFKAGSESRLIIRPSVAKYDPVVLSPGLGVKVLIDNQPSQNFHTIFTTEGQPGNNNFLANVVSNYFVNPPVIPPVLAGLIRAMEMGMMLLAGGIEGRPEGVNNMGLVEQSAVESDGTPVPEGQVVAPWKIDFVPNSALGASPDTTDDFRVQLRDIPVGSALYFVELFRTKEDFYGGFQGTLVGEVILDTKLIASKYCDENLFMRHARKRWHA